MSLTLIIEVVDLDVSGDDQISTEGGTSTIIETKNDAQNTIESSSLFFFKDNSSIIWMFEKVGGNEAKITGSYFGECDATLQLSILRVPGEVCNNISYSIEAETDKLIWADIEDVQNTYPVTQIGERIIHSTDPVLNAIATKEDSKISTTIDSNKQKKLLSGIVSLSIPFSIESIGKYAFNMGLFDLAGVESINFEEGSRLKTVGSQAFYSIGHTRDPPVSTTLDGNHLAVNENGNGCVTVNKNLSGTEHTIIMQGQELVLNLTEDQYTFITQYKGKKEVGPSVSVTNNSGTIKLGIDRTVTVDISDIKQVPDGSYNVVVYYYKSNTAKFASSYCSFRVVKDLYNGVSVSLPDSTEWIAQDAFKYVTGLSIGANSQLKTVYPQAFGALAATETVVLPPTIQTIYRDSFGSAKLEFSKQSRFQNVDGNILEDLGESRNKLHIYNGTATEYSFDDGIARSITEVADGAFKGSSVNVVKLRDGISWGEYPFDGLTLKMIYFNGIRDIPDYCFGRINYSSDLVIPMGVETIGDNAFFGASIKTIVFEADSHIRTIGRYAFAHNVVLQSVSFGSSHDDCSCLIDEGAFIGCSNLRDVILDDKFVLTSIGDYAFTKKSETVNNQNLIKVPLRFNSNSEYDIVIPSGVVFIGKFAFSGIDKNSFDKGLYPTQNPTKVMPQTGGYRIIFETNSNLLTLSNDSFAIGNLIKVDMSNCSKIESIIGFTSPRELILPNGDNLVTIHMSSVKSNDPDQLQSITIPKSVREVSGLIYQDITFESGSQLETVVCSGRMDLSNCKILKSVTLGGSAVLPDGVYSIIKPVDPGFTLEGCIENLSQIVVDATAEGKIIIDSSVHALNKDLLGLIEFTGGNEIIWVEDGLVCSKWNGMNTAFGVSVPDLSSIEIKADSSIQRLETGALGNDADNIVFKIGKELEYNDSIFGQPTIPESRIEFSKIKNGIDYTQIVVDYREGRWIISGHTADGVITNLSQTDGLSKIYVASDVIQVKFGEGVARVVSGSDTNGWADIQMERDGNSVILRGHDDKTYINLICYATSVPSANIFLSENLTFPSNAFSNSGDMYFTFNVIGEHIAEEALEFGAVRVGKIAGDHVVYIPYDLDEMVMHLRELKQSKDDILLSASIDGGYTFYDVDVIGVEHASVQDAHTIMMPSGVERNIFLDIIPKDRSNGECRVTFQSDSSNAISAIYIPKGMTILDSEIPVAVKDNYVFNEWMYGGSVYDFDTPVVRNIILIASWLERNPIVSVVTPAGDVTINGEHTSVFETSKDTATATIGITVFEGYEFLGWTYVQSDKVQTYEGSTLTLQNIDSDVTVSVDYRYYSTSSGLVPIVNRGFPTTDEITSAVKSWSAGGKMNMSGMNWTGHSSVPLIVDDYVYLRIGDKLCKVESDTGYCVASVPSVSQTTFYHQLGYGNGLIIDYATSKVYDAGLELRFILDRTITGAEYHDGMFYTSGDDLYRFPADSSKAVNGTMHLEFVGTFDKKIYSSYGFSSGIFHNDALYRVSADGSSRGIAWMKLDGSGQGYTELAELSNMYMDDGWMSLNGDILYIGGYTEGLFGSVARSGYSTMAYMRINSDSSISDVKYIVFDGTAGTVKSSGFISEFVVCEGIGFVNVNSKLYAYRMNDDGTPKEIMASGDFSFGHGSFVIDSSHSSEEGNPLYVYMIPYRSGGGASTMAVMKCFWSGTDYVMKPVQAYNFESNYNSQALRAGLDGQMIWYNDSGWVYSYANPEDNRYFLFIRDGDSGRWYESTGGSAYAAFSKLGSDVLTFGKMKNLSTVNGRSAMDFSMYVVKYGDVSLKTYATPTQVFDLRDSANDVYHYYIITSESGALAEGGSWSYIDDSMNLKTYAFKFNIGDRSLVGKNMAVTGKESVVTFYDGETVVGKDMGAIGSGSDTIVMPDLVKPKQFVIWDGLPEEFKESGYSVRARWIPTLDITTSSAKGMLTITSELARNAGDESELFMALVTTYGDHVTWTFVEVTWDKQDKFEYYVDTSLNGLTSAKVLLVNNHGFEDCNMLAIAECELTS